MNFWDRIALLCTLLLAAGAAYDAKEAHRHTHLILCQQGVELEGAHCHD